MAVVIDKVAWIHTEGGKVLSTRSRGKDAYDLEVVWLAYGDRPRTSPVDRLVFDHLHAAGLLS